MIFTPEQILDLKNKIDIKDFYSQFLTLKRVGNNLVANCCFHSGDKTPSLYICPETGIFHCFACGASGDLFTFYQKLTGKTFTEAVLEIAKSQGIEIEIDEATKKDFIHKKALYLTNLNVAKLYQKALSQSKEGQAYMIKRGFNLDTIKKFKLGYVPKFDLSQLNKQMIPFLLENSLIFKNSNGGYYNYFSPHRISIPFFDEYGNIVSFSTRVTNNDIHPKYLHGKLTSIFKKDEVLFGYNLAKKTIKDTKSVIFVEGQIDCIKAHQYGITSCVALCGLGLSDKQIKKFKTDVKNYYLIVEDIKGEEAIDRLYDTIIANNFWSNIKVVRLYEKDEKCDLDEFLTKYGKSVFLDKIKHAPTYHEYKILEMLKHVNYHTIDEKKFYIYNVRKYITKISNPIDKKQYIEMLADKLELPEIDVRRIISKAESLDKKIVIGDYDNRRITSQKYILASFFSHYGINVAYDIITKLKVQSKLESSYKKILKNIIKAILEHGKDCDLINILHSCEYLSESEMAIVDDAYFKKEDYQYIDTKEELSLFILDQLKNIA